MGTYSGAVVRAYTQADKPSMAFHPDPLHGEVLPDQTVPESHMTDPGQGQEYVGTDFPMDLAVGDGAVLATPVVSHDGVAGRRQVYDEAHEVIQTGPLHAEDGQRGWVRDNFTDPPYQFSDTEYHDVYRGDSGIYAHANNSGAPALLAGINGVPQNNPEGIREGMIRRRWMERDARDLSPRTYTRYPRPLWDRRQHVQANTPAQSDNPLTLTPVLQMMMPTGVRRRSKFTEMFRMPAAFDDSLLAAEQPVDASAIGGGW